MKTNSFSRAIFAVIFAASSFILSPDLIPAAQNGKNQEAEKQDAAKQKPIKAMLITGGCCHDYEQQKKIITEGISARCKIKIDWTIVHQGGKTTNTKIPLFENKDWAKGFDIVIHNECFAKIDDKDWVERVLKPHREGVNAIVIHCAMHTFRDLKSNEYRDFLGVESRSHGPHHSYKVENLEPEDPIMKGFGEDWETPQGELYYVNNIGGKATPLARAFSSGGRKKQEVCIWKNEYGKSRVFGTTIGHHNETMSTPKYLNFLTRGFLWAVDRFDEKHITSPPIKKIRKNLAFRKPAIASANQDPHLPRAATDGSTSTRYCADNAEPNDWFQVDLEKPEELTGVQVHWEQSGKLYRFKLEGSADGKKWQMLFDGTKNKSKDQVQTYDFKAKNIRYLKMTCTETVGGWYSFFEFRVFGTKFEEIDEAAFLNRPLNDPATLLAKMKIPEGFDAKIFAAPPQANYPVCLTTTYDGVVFVGVDKNGSLDKQKGRGKVVRCIDKDRDGVADEFTTFCEVDSPRGLVWDRDRLFVLHPPDLSVYYDDDGDGKADRKETVVKGIGFDLDFRGADHTTNGIRMGIDGWIYVAVGDYGFIKAVGTDKTELQLKGGGVVRVRPDGTGLEVYARGLRNICDIAIDPFMNIFTRDNTNDGGGWDIRVSHIIQSANYGYPSLYKNFNDEIMPPMADYGGGSGTGALYVSEESLPKKYQNALFTCDWGQSKVFFHPLKKDGATFTVEQEDFLSIPRPTDMDVDANGNIYVASWNNGRFKYDGENIGYIVVLRPKGAKQKKLPNLKSMNNEEVGKQLLAGSDAMRRAAFREIRNRCINGDKESFKVLDSVVMEGNSLESKAAYAYLVSELGQLFPSTTSVQRLERLKSFADEIQPNVKHAMVSFIRSLVPTKRQENTSDVLSGKPEPIQLAILQGIGQLPMAGSASGVIDFASKIKIDRSNDKGVKTPVNSSGKALRHVAIQTLARIAEVDELLKAANADSAKATVAFDALKYIHSKEAVNGLIGILSNNKTNQQAWETLIRLYHTEGPYTGKWWGTRPDTTGPYYTRDKWEMTDTIEDFIERNFARCDKPTQTFIAVQLDRHKVKLPNLAGVVKNIVKASQPTVEMVVKVPTFDKNNPNQLGNIKYDVAVSKIVPMEGNIKKGAEIFKQQSCAACHTVEKDAKAVGPQLVDIGKRYNRTELLESIIKPNAKIAQGFATQIFATEEGLTYTGFVTREAGDEVEIRTAEGKSIVISKNIIEARKESKNSVMPEGLVSNLTAKQMASLLAYLESLKTDAK